MFGKTSLASSCMSFKILWNIWRSMG